MSKTYFEVVERPDGTYVSRVYSLRVENPPGVVLIPGGLEAEFEGTEEYVREQALLETEKLEA
jgi:hypothetical protein